MQSQRTRIYLIETLQRTDFNVLEYFSTHKRIDITEVIFCKHDTSILSLLVFLKLLESQQIGMWSTLKTNIEADQKWS